MKLAPFLGYLKSPISVKFDIFLMRYEIKKLMKVVNIINYVIDINY